MLLTCASCRLHPDTLVALAYVAGKRSGRRASSREMKDRGAPFPCFSNRATLPTRHANPDPWKRTAHDAALVMSLSCCAACAFPSVRAGWFVGGDMHDLRVPISCCLSPRVYAHHPHHVRSNRARNRKQGDRASLFSVSISYLAAYRAPWRGA